MRFLPIALMLLMIVLLAAGCERPVNDEADQQPTTTSGLNSNQRNYTVAQEGDTVSVEYEGRLSDGTVFDSSARHNRTLVFEVGGGQMIPGFDAAVEGMEKGDEKVVVIQPEDAYGVDEPQLIQEVPLDRFPPNTTFEVGMQVGIRTAAGQQLPAQVIAVNEDNVTIDANHPLAGEVLNFSITLVEIRP